MDDHVNFSAEYAGALRVPFVNRAPLLDKIHKAILDRSQVHVFYITGRGGMGKTYLLREILKRLQREGSWYRPDILAASDEVDLFHAETHSREGLMAVIRETLRTNPWYFENYRKEKDRLERYKLDLESAKDVDRQREFVAQEFLTDFNRLAEDHRVVFAIDTAEELLYEADEIQELLDLGEEGIEARGWLIKEFLPNARNCVVLIAGRPESPALERDLRESLGDHLHVEELGPLDENDTLDYFNAVASVANKVGKTRIAEQLERLGEETRRVIYHYTGGQPILLSLMIDYLTVADRLLPAMGASLKEVISQQGDQLERIRQALAADIIRAILEANRPADRAILALAWARRGLDAMLLSRLMGQDVESAKGLLQNLTDLSFIKVRTRDNTYFLQDEMYRLLKQHSLDNLLPMQMDEAFATLVSYSREKLRDARQDYGVIQQRYFASPEQASPALLAQLAAARLDLQRRITDVVHYRLWLNAVDGFEWYYRYAEEAFRSNEESLDLEIRDELLRFLKEAHPDKVGAIKTRATWDNGLRWMKRSINRGKYSRAQNIAVRLRKDCANLMHDAGPLAEAELNIWEGWVLAYRGEDLTRAESGLRHAIDVVRNFDPAANSFDSWYQQVLLANARNNLGYLLRARGRFADSIEHYRGALPIWRELKLEAEHANTLNNLALALAEIGEFDQALRYAQDGLELRHRLGPRYPIGLSLNTLGLIQVRYDQPERAQSNCEQALGIFRELEQQRGVGLACIALAEALRRRTRAPGIRNIQRNVALLREALDHGRDALDIFTNTFPERLRLIEALLELGCIYREWARLRQDYKSEEDPKHEDLAEAGEAALRRAANEAHELFLHKEVDALVNLAWLRYYVHDPEGARQIIEEQVYEIAKEYRTLENPSLPQPADPNAFIWAQLGKSHLLLGQIAFDRYQELDEQRKETGGEVETAEDFLRQAAWHYTFSLAYDELFAKDFRDLRAGLDAIYRNLKKLNPRELHSVYQKVRQTTHDFNLYSRYLDSSADQRKTSRMQTFLETSFGLRNGDEQGLS